MKSKLRLTPSANNRGNWRRPAIGVVIFLFLPSFILAEDQPAEVDTNGARSGDQIQIVADKLITNDLEKYAEFVGDVKTTHPDFVMASESLRIYYKDNLSDLKNKSGDQEFIKRIVASGNVTIKSDNFTAETQSAEYDIDTMILVLDGENSMVQRGKNILTGAKITIYRKDEKIKVEGSPHERVRAVFYSNKTAETQQ